MQREPTPQPRIEAVSRSETVESSAGSPACRILGIDPGSRLTGYGVVDVCNAQLRYVASGCIDARHGDFPTRLAVIYRGIAELIDAHAPSEFAIEEVFFARNPQSALKLGHARGVAIAAAVGANLAVHEYAPRSVKQAVVGSGRASKAQIAYMVRALLALDAEPQEDAADALAVAICHVNTRRQAISGLTAPSESSSMNPVAAREDRHVPRQEHDRGRCA